ncbi:2-C-methyl-D-erythritol 4-phosphate cytidylyltransferase [Bacillaceae bacterium]
MGEERMKVGVVIAAAGQGKRMGAGKNKLFLPLAGRPVFVHTVELFVSCSLFREIVIVVSEGDVEEVRRMLRTHGLEKVTLAVGGNERQHSVYAGLNALREADVVLVHDGARPFVRVRDIERLLAALATSEAAILAVPVKDTIKVVSGDRFVEETPARESLWAVQTPQAFRLSVLLEAHRRARREGFLGTDDASLVERLGVRVKVIEGDYENIKLTTPDDLSLAEAILKRRGERGK